MKKKAKIAIAPAKKRGRPKAEFKKDGNSPVIKDESKQGNEWIDSAHTVTYEWQGGPVETKAPDYKAIALELLNDFDTLRNVFVAVSRDEIGFAALSNIIGRTEQKIDEIV